MASSSSSSLFYTTPNEKYEVFLSFRGEDTRNNFTSHLYAALCHKNIYTFIDDNELRKGDRISPSLLSAIEGSKISVVIFSQGYASSKWCLEELGRILDCRERYGQIVIPVFYDVDPSHVKNQTGTFGDEFAKLAKHCKDMLQIWKDALREAANLSGFDSKVTRPEASLIENIVKDILHRLNDESPPVYNRDLVGVDLTAEYIERLLCLGCDGVQKLGIWGIGGIGKTTLAQVVFKRISKHFESSYFVQNIREESEKGLGRLRELGKELICAILDDRHPNILSTFTKKRLGRKKVFIVFDDVTCWEQIKCLIEDLDDLGSGSRIIITTRDKQVLRNCGVDQIHEVHGLSDDDGIQLFSQYAFKRNYPEENYVRLSREVVRYAGGVPLALKTLGSFLFGKKTKAWENTINKLEKGPPKDIQKVLIISYDGLDDEEKAIFLDIACFFKGQNINDVKEILNACGFSSEIGIEVLIDKSLITISLLKTVEMHDLLQETGRAIVQQESIYDPGKRSRLWHHDDIYRVLSNNTGTKAILGICLDMSKIEDLHLNRDAFTKMRNLRLLKLHGSTNENKVHGFESIESDFRELRYFFFEGYPSKSMPSNIHFKNLVELHLPGSNLEQLWIGNKSLHNLKHLNLRQSTRLSKISDLLLAPNIERLVLRNCTRLQEISSSVLSLNKLVYLDLAYCCNFQSLPIIISSKSLKHINLSGFSEIQELPSSICYSSRLVNLHLCGCSRLGYLPSSICDMKSLKSLDLSGCSSLKMVPELPCGTLVLNLSGTGVRELPFSIEFLIELRELDLKNCSRLESLPNGICKLKSLEGLYLSGCSQLNKLPEQLGNLEALEFLHTDETAIREFPFSILSLKNLSCLSSRRCNMLQPLPLDFQVLPSVRLQNLEELDLTYCCIIELPNNLGQLSSISKLLLGGNNFESLPASIIDLEGLEVLDLSKCGRLQSLPELPYDLRLLAAEGCSSLKALSDLSTLFPTDGSKVIINFINCFKLDWNAITDALKNVTWTHNTIDIIFPGSEIPEWFDFQSTGSSMELPFACFNDNLLTFDFCLVVSLHDFQINKSYFTHKHKHMKLEFELIVHDLRRVDHLLLDFSLDDTKNIKLDHVILGFNKKPIILSRIRCSSLQLSKYYNKAFIRFDLKIADGYRDVIGSYRVKKCGLRLGTRVEDVDWNKLVGE